MLNTRFVSWWVVPRLLAVAARPCRPVELHSGNLNRRLEIDVAQAGPQRWLGILQVLFGRRVFELEADDDQAGADGEPFRRVIGRCRDRAEEQRGVRERRARGDGQHEADEREKPSESHDPNDTIGTRRWTSTSPPIRSCCGAASANSPRPSCGRTSREWDEAQQFPRELLSKLAALGLMGIQFPEEFGGAAMSSVDYCICIEELARVDPSVCLSVAAHNGLGAAHIAMFGTEEQKQHVSRAARDAARSSPHGD